MTNISTFKVEREHNALCSLNTKHIIRILHLHSNIPTDANKQALIQYRVSFWGKSFILSSKCNLARCWGTLKSNKMRLHMHTMLKEIKYHLIASQLATGNVHIVMQFSILPCISKKALIDIRYELYLMCDVISVWVFCMGANCMSVVGFHLKTGNAFTH